MTDIGTHIHQGCDNLSFTFAKGLLLLMITDVIENLFIFSLQVFSELLCEKKGKISVFYCGPPSLSSELTTKCRQYGFAFKKELF